MELKVIVPTSLSEITLEQYQRFARLEGDEEFLTKKMLEIFCNVPIEELPNIRFKDVSNVSKHLRAMMEEKPSITLKFSLNGHDFGFIPSLEDITYGEFVDIDNYLTDVENLHKTMAVLYRPIIGKVGKYYVIEDYESSSKYCDTMKQAPMNIVLGAVLFFWTLGRELLTATLTSLEDQKEQKIIAQNLNSLTDGDGTTLSIPSLKVMLEDLMRYHGYPFTNALPSFPMRSTKPKPNKEYLKAI